MKPRETQPKEQPTRPEPPVRRRDFLKLAGFSLGAVSLGACERGPIEKAIPYLVQPDGITPGEPTYYTTVCGACPAGCGMLAKTLDGRPIKLEGNPDHPVSGGALCATGQASILELYDSHRLRAPLIDGRPSDWDALDAEVRETLGRLGAAGKKLYVLSRTVNSPTLARQIRSFVDGYPGAGRWVQYDPVSSSAMRAAHQLTHGLKDLPDFRLDRAEVIVGIDADFLGTWISPVEFGRAYRTGRTLEGSRLRFSFHYQFEPLLSITGAKADYRIPTHPEAAARVAAAIAVRVAERSGRPLDLPRPDLPGLTEAQTGELIDRLYSFRGKSLILCGAQDLSAQILTNYTNFLLQNYGRTLDIQYPSYRRLGWEEDLRWLLEDLERGDVGALLVLGANPVYELPFGEQLASLMQSVPLSIAFGTHLDETASHARIVCPEPHYLESWGDSQPSARVVSLRQPVMERPAGIRSPLECLERWVGGRRDEYSLVRAYWQETLFEQRFGFGPFEEFWNQALVDGTARIRPRRVDGGNFDLEALSRIDAARLVEEPPGADRYLVLYPSVTIGDGSHALNPWLQEAPDPLSRACWTNPLVIPPDEAGGPLEDGRIIRIENTVGGELRLPASVQPGLHEAAVGAALGYGRKGTERFAKLGPDWVGAPRAEMDSRVGVRLHDQIVFDGPFFRYHRKVRLEVTAERGRLAVVQSFPERDGSADGVVPGTDIVRTGTMEELLLMRPVEQRPEAPNLWPEEHRYAGHHWGMVVDLGACTGCSACVVACQAENNVPCVGEDEVQRHREMHWLRIDRYYVQASGSPDVYFQPMLCQQCDRAPCETVCPVLATVHDAEGLNEQIYNRCVGTRYCMNNCPYKVRAFNWFDYARGDTLENLQLNPEVTVRARGVAEKCSFCIQRIQRARIDAAASGDKPTIQTACQQTCPSGAIVFGDLNDPESPIAGLVKSPRGYRVLDQLGTRPSVLYLAAVRNRPDPTEENG